MTDDPIFFASSQERNIAMLTHFGGIILFFIPSLMVWLLKKDESKFIAAHAREALNFQITLLIIYIVLGVLTHFLLGLFGILMFGLLWLGSMFLCGMAGSIANKGELREYPFALHLVK
ncbi:MAG: DUF4870 domain-containing protein [Methylobacillus sp.]|jgi:uncharacterized Tic20 family protein|nr:DUF4870 domain-containing protein [Methylobacillus sp.]